MKMNSVENDFQLDVWKMLDVYFLASIESERQSFFELIFICIFNRILYNTLIQE